MKKSKPVLWLVFGIFILIVPTIVYLCFLVPKLSEEYNILMASGGVIGGAGLYGANAIPEKIKYGGLYKTAAKAFSIMTVITLVEKFIISLIGLVAVFLVCFIIFKIFMEIYRNGRTRKQNTELATEISRSITENIK